MVVLNTLITKNPTVIKSHAGTFGIVYTFTP